ncbi:MAG: hypothetical protein AAGG07_10035 [Planctomycetota bacterium]
MLIRSVIIASLACASAVAPTAQVSAQVTEENRRPLVLHDEDGKWIGHGVCYGPHRDGMTPGEQDPTSEQILEDLLLMDPYFDVIRTYAVGDNERHMLRHIKERGLGLKLVMGVWIRPESELDPERNPGRAIGDGVEFNNDQVRIAVELCNEYPDIVSALVIGNETQVGWSFHPVNEHTLARRIREIRDQITQPVSTADLWDWWSSPTSDVVAAECDFVGLHAYAMWSNQPIDGAMQWTRDRIEDVRSFRPDMPIYMCELGWATNKHTEGDQGRLITGTADEANQELFYRSWRSYAGGVRQPYLWFQAFDEKWKGGPHVNEVEKHWGLFNSDRTPKRALSSGPASEPLGEQ